MPSAQELGIWSWKGLRDHLVVPLHQTTKEKSEAQGDLVQGEDLGLVAELGEGSRALTFHKRVLGAVSQAILPVHIIPITTLG